MSLSNSNSNSSPNNIFLQLLDPNSSIIETFIASLRSVGAACMLALVGIYLHRRGFIVGEGKKTLALICQQALIPTYLCVKTMYCNQNNSDKSCPDVVKSLNQIWILLIWPAYVVSVGAICAYIFSLIIKPPKKQIKAMYAAIMFGNSTALPITMLTVVHSNFPKSSILGKVDPTLFLSIYLLLYPVLQWGIGGWLLAPDSDNDEDEITNGKTHTSKSYGTLDTSSEQGFSTIAEESSGAGSGFGSTTGSPATLDDHEKIALLRKHEFETAREHDHEARRNSSVTPPRVFRHVVNILPDPPRFIRTLPSSDNDESDQHRKSVSLGTLKVNVHQQGSAVGSNSHGGLTPTQGQGRNRSSSTGSYGQYAEMMGGMDNSQTGGGMGDRGDESFGLRTGRSSVHVPAYEMTLEVRIIMRV
jgi:predicted permease